MLALADSAGAHVAAKLECFGSDERTLTEELCDMMYVWARIGGPLSGGAARAPSFDLTITKVSQREEVRTGADLELIVTSPQGVKRALIQAKVLDPADLSLRCDSPKGWAKLRTQLKSAHTIVPGLAFLMVYVPGGELNGEAFAYGTWEQNFLATSGSGASSRFGASLFGVEDLLSRTYRWRYRDKVRYDGGGSFQVAPLSLSQLLLDMLLCSRGVWSRGAPIRCNTSRRMTDPPRA